VLPPPIVGRGRPGGHSVSRGLASQPEDPLLVTREGHSDCLLGNEAIVRGALEAGVAFASGYPGTPSSEITDSFARIASSRGIVFEYSVNEKVALEMAFAASLAGARSICSMKHLGLLVAGDPLSTIPYIGVEAGMVIVSAGDPGCGTSPNEQDQRLLGPMLHVPILDPSTPREAQAMTRFAFELSESCRLPVILRITTHVCHTRAIIQFGELVEPNVAGFTRNPPRYNPIPVNARRMRAELAERMEQARGMLAQSGFLQCLGADDATTVVLATGAAAATCADLLAKRNDEESVAFWSLGIAHPLPEADLVARLRGVERVLVVEELAPFIEDAIQLLCARNGLPVEVLGKRSGYLPEMYEYRPPVIEAALRRVLDGDEESCTAPVAVPVVPRRPPTLCPGCPHRAAFLAARSAFHEDQLFFNDIGCYTLGYAPPLQTSDALVCMGAGFTLAAGVSRVTGKRTVGFLGDSTFFHAGMPPLLNAVKERVNMVGVILDNRVTAMTGFQESPGHPEPRTTLGADGEITTDPPVAVSIEQVVRALGVEHVELVDPFDHAATVAAFRRAREATGVSVVIVEQGCPVHEIRRSPGEVQRPLFQVNPDACQQCGRASDGHQCAQAVTIGFERQLSRGRTMRCGEGAPGQAPCSANCPLSLCVEGYVGHVAAGDYNAALGHVMERNALPETVCRICHRPCETACVRTTSDSAIAINDLKRFVVTTTGGNAVTSTIANEPAGIEAEPGHGHRVAVVGAGPAGLAAANDLCLRGYEVTLIDASDRAGGLLAHGIPAHRLPPEAIARDVKRILSQGVLFRGGVRVGRDVTLDDLLGEGYDAVVIAVGAGRARTLDLTNAPDGANDAPNVTTAIEFLGQLAANGSVETGARVVVVGGGNAAIDASCAARRLGAQSVTLAFPESREEMPAIPSEISAAQEEGVAIRPGLVPVRLASSALLCRSAGDDSSGDKGVALDADLVILAIGQDPVLDFATVAGTALDRDGEGHLAVDPQTGRTSHAQVFAAGDAAGARRMVTTAMASGLRAAWAIDRAIRPDEADRRRPPVQTQPLPTSSPQSSACDAPTPLPVFRFPSHRAPTLPATNRTQSFDEVTGTLSEAAARAEASRCLMCGRCGNCRACLDLFACPALREADGHVTIDAILCTGCGVCAAICPNDAIQEVSRA